MIGSIPWFNNTRKKRRRGRPYVYSPAVIVRCFVVRIWFRLDSNNALHIFLNMDCHYNLKLALACGLLTIPSRRTFDRRLKTISTDIKERISTMGNLFVAAEGFIADPTITAIDSTLIKANGHLWHKSSMRKKEWYLVLALIRMQDGDIVIPRGWIFGYKLHLTSTTELSCSTFDSRCNHCKCTG